MKYLEIFTSRFPGSAILLIAVLYFATGCATANGSIVKMARQDVVGEVVSKETTKETITTADGKTATKVTERVVTMSAPGADFELKKLGITTVGKVGIAKAKASALIFGSAQCSSMYGCSGSYGGYSSMGGGYGSSDAQCRNPDGNIVFCRSMSSGSNMPRGVFTTLQTPAGSNIVFKN